MGSCHYCFNCGRCRGETPPAVYVRTCPACGLRNEEGSRQCARCAEGLLMDPGRIYRELPQARAD